MRILTIGDIVGEKSLVDLEVKFPRIIKENGIDFVIANGENVIKARGITKEAFLKLLKIGVNVVTMGNHTFSNAGIEKILDHPNLIIPANFSKETIEKGYGIYEWQEKKILVANLLGKHLGASLNSFDVIEAILSKINADVKIRIVDYHSEYGNEKKAMAYFLKNRISALYGTHTHVQTADEQILAFGEGFITDIGMCGPKESAIGYDIDFEIQRYQEKTGEDSILSEDEQIMINGCIFDIDETTGKTLEIKRLQID